MTLSKGIWIGVLMLAAVATGSILSASVNPPVRRSAQRLHAPAIIALMPGKKRIDPNNE